MMRFRTMIWIASVSALAVTGCACSQKGKASSGTHDTLEVAMGDIWNIQDETVIKADSEANIEKIKLLFADYDSTDDDPVPHIHMIYEVKEGQDLAGIEQAYADYGVMGTTFEVVIPQTLKGESIISMTAPDSQHSRVIISGKGDGQVDLDLVGINVKADLLVVRNLRWKSQEYRYAIRAQVKTGFIGENLTFADNHFPTKLEHLASPLITLGSYSESTSRYILRNVSFINNGSASLLTIDRESEGKFDHILIDHLTLKDNSCRYGGIDISAKSDALVKSSQIEGIDLSASLIQHHPETQLTLEDSSVSGKVYMYDPNMQQRDIPAKPIIKKNVSEADGTEFLKAP